jgi:SAM-dependent methyltransferase
MNLGPNTPCHCGSGRKYKYCHRPIDDAPLDHKYAAAQTVYAKNWKATSRDHYEQRDYRWMAEILEPFSPKRIFDVGCGSGHGLLALFDVLGPDLQIVSVDENAACLDVANQTLGAAGISVDAIKRLETVVTPLGYELVTTPIAKPLTAQCTLIESDICNDSSLELTLSASERFDAVTIWLTGTHMMRKSNANVMKRSIRSEGSHRLYVQNKVYELADQLLKPGGVLQVVDRGEAPTSELLREDDLRAHREQASVASLQVMDLKYKSYEPLRGNRTPMRGTPGTSGRVPVTFELALTSVVSIKPPMARCHS